MQFGRIAVGERDYGREVDKEDFGGSTFPGQ